MALALALASGSQTAKLDNLAAAINAQEIHRMGFDINKATPAELKARLAELEAQVAAKNKPAELTCNVSEKGGISVYGLGQFPVTLYVEQWDRLIAYVPVLAEFLKANRAIVRAKGQDDWKPTPELAKLFADRAEKRAARLAKQTPASK